MKHLHHDISGQERLLPVLIFVACLVIISSFLIALMVEGGLFEQQAGGGNVAEWYQIQREYMIPTAGRPITSANITDDPTRTLYTYPEGGYGMRFYYTDVYPNDWMRVDIVRDNKYYTPGSSVWWQKYKDFFRVESDYGVNVAIPFAAVVTGNGIASFSMWADNHSIVVEDVAGLYDDDYTLYLTENTQAASMEWWTIPIHLLTWSLPGLVWPFNMIVGVIFDVTVGFLIFMFWSRFWHGGG